MNQTDLCRRTRSAFRPHPRLRHGSRTLHKRTGPKPIRPLDCPSQTSSTACPTIRIRARWRYGNALLPIAASKDAIDHDGAYHATRSRTESGVRERVECRQSCSTIRDGHLFDNTRAFQTEVSLYQMIQNSLNGSGPSSPDLCQSFYTRRHRVTYTKMPSFSVVESASCIWQQSHLT